MQLHSAPELQVIVAVEMNVPAVIPPLPSECGSVSEPCNRSVTVAGFSLTHKQVPAEKKQKQNHHQSLEAGDGTNAQRCSSGANGGQEQYLPSEFEGSHARGARRSAGTSGMSAQTTRLTSPGAGARVPAVRPLCLQQLTGGFLDRKLLLAPLITSKARARAQVSSWCSRMRTDAQRHALSSRRTAAAGSRASASDDVPAAPRARRRTASICARAGLHHTRAITHRHRPSQRLENIFLKNPAADTAECARALFEQLLCLQVRNDKLLSIHLFKASLPVANNTSHGAFRLQEKKGEIKTSNPLECFCLYLVVFV